MIFGKLLGALFGFAWFGFIGLLLGVYLGHQFDKALKKSFSAPSAGHQVKTQEAFFRATFVMMGYLAKADGQVSKQEIRWAEYVMGRMNL